VLQKALGHEVILDALVLDVAVHRFNILKVLLVERHQWERRFIYIVCHDERPVKSVVTKELKLLGIVVPIEFLFISLHVEDMKNELGLTGLLVFRNEVSVLGVVAARHLVARLKRGELPGAIR
jgi:hypothetical protein